jgi:hypothetical protein
MKRFFCTVCQRVKHVRKYPTSVDNPFAVSPQDRIGQCSWHVIGHVHPERLIPRRPVKVVTVPASISKKAKRG